ncbi:MAG: hypothetical protein WC758_01020 [Candidatus Woesearchaeota archaeon]|jgi:tetratricopeptide (TPR) repeat protein
MVKTSVEDKLLIETIDWYYSTIQSNDYDKFDNLSEIKGICVAISSDKLTNDELVAEKHKFAGLAAYNLGELTDALKFLNISIKSGFVENEVYKTIAKINFAKREFDLAINNMSKEIKLFNGYSQAYNDRGVMQYKLGNFDDALIDFNCAIKKDKNNDVALMNRSFIRLLEGDYETALKDVTLASNVGSNLIKKRFNRAIISHALNRNDDTMDDLYAVVELDAKSSEDFYFRAQAKMHIFEFDSAIVDFEIGRASIDDVKSNIFLGDWNRFQKENEIAELLYVESIKAFLDKKSKFTTDYLMVNRAILGLKKLNVLYDQKIPSIGVVGIKSISPDMVDNYLRLYI